MGYKAKRTEAQRQQIAKWGHMLHGLCPIPPEDCLVHGDATACLHHCHPSEWSVAQATAFRDVILPNVPQVRTGFTLVQRSNVEALVNVVIRRKQGLAVSAADIPAPIPEWRSMSAGQIQLVRDLESLAGRGSAPPSPAHPTTAATAERTLQAKLAQAQQQVAQAQQQIHQLTTDADTLRASAQQHTATEQSLRDKLRLAEAETARLRAARSQPPPLPSHANNAAAVSAELRALQLGFAALVPVAHQIPQATLAGTTACLSAGAAVVQKFLAGLKRCSLSLADVTRRQGGQRQDFVVAFHGTGDAGSILCHGFDPSKRSGQQHGPGEYFAEDWQTASQYALRHGSYHHQSANTAAVVVTLLIKSQAKRVNGKWFIVDNAADGTSTFCLPVVALSAGPSSAHSWQLPACSVCVAPATAAAQKSTPGAPASATPASTPSPLSVEFMDVSNAWTAMGAVDAAKVVAAFAPSTVARKVFSRQQFSYDVDFDRMVQINTSTRVERNIRFGGVSAVEYQHHAGYLFCAVQWVRVPAGDSAAVIVAGHGVNNRGVVKGVLTDSSGRHVDFDFTRKVRISPTEGESPFRHTTQ